MSNNFIGTGNLGKAAKLSHFKHDGEDRCVLEFSVFFERNKPAPNGVGFVDNGGFWLNVSWFGKKAELAAPQLNQKGIRVKVEGELKLDSWEKDGEAKSQLVVEARDVTLDFLGIESVTRTPKKSS